MKRLFALLALLASPAFATDPQFGAIRVEASPNMRHSFVSAQAQSANSNLVSKNEWNAAHTVPTALIVSVPTGIVWPAQPAAVTEFCGGSTSYRWRADLTNQTSIRLTAQVVSAGAASSALRLQYTTDLTGATGWDYLDSVSGPSVSTSASGVTTSATVSIATAAKAEVLLRLVGINGDGAGGSACYSAIKASTATLADSATTATTATSATTATTATTAGALSANGANCSAGSFPLGVDASGAAESCTALPTTIAGTSNQITASAATGAITLSIPTNPTLPGTTTGTFSGNLTGNVTGNVSGSSGSATGNAGTATALAANGANCSAGNYPLGVDASGAVEGCTAASSLTIDALATETYCLDAVGTDAYACSFAHAPASLNAMLGAVVTFKTPTANTGAATFAPNGLSATGIVKQIAGATTALATGDIKANTLVTVQYDGTNFVCLSCSGLTAKTDGATFTGVTQFTGSTFLNGFSGHSTVTAVTSTATTAANTTNVIFTNTGDTDGATITLMDNPTAGTAWYFAVTVAQTLTIVKSSGETLMHGASTCGTSLTSNTIGSTIEIRAVTGGSGAVFMTFGATGTWTCNA